MKKSYLIEFPIGDWSDDGHGNCRYYIVISNKPVEEIREAHFKIKPELDIDIHSIDQGEYWKSEDPKMEDPQDLVDIWIECLMKVDPDLKLIREVRDRKTISFYGFDEKERHIDFVGYTMMGD